MRARTKIAGIAVCLMLALAAGLAATGVPEEARGTGPAPAVAAGAVPPAGAVVTPAPPAGDLAWVLGIPAPLPPVDRIENCIAPCPIQPGPGPCCLNLATNCCFALGGPSLCDNFCVVPPVRF